MHSKIIHYLDFGIQLKYIYTYTERKRYTHTSTLRPNPHLSVPGPYLAILDKTHYTVGQDFTLHYHYFFGVPLGRSFCSLCPQSHWFSQQLHHSEVCSAFTCLCALWQPRGTPLSVKEAQTFHWSLIWTVLFKFQFYDHSSFLIFKNSEWMREWSWQEGNCVCSSIKINLNKKKFFITK